MAAISPIRKTTALRHASNPTPGSRSVKAAESIRFLVALLAFAAARTDYSHLTKAVSELGAIGAPHALAWNILGFGAVGVLVVIFAWGLWRQKNAPLAAA